MKDNLFENLLIVNQSIYSLINEDGSIFKKIKNKNEAKKHIKRLYKALETLTNNVPSTKLLKDFADFYERNYIISGEYDGIKYIKCADDACNIVFSYEKYDISIRSLENSINCIIYNNSNISKEVQESNTFVTTNDLSVLEVDYKFIIDAINEIIYNYTKYVFDISNESMNMYNKKKNRNIRK